MPEAAFQNAVNADSRSHAPGTRCGRSMLFMSFPHRLVAGWVIDNA
jgi:hypothetical protein